MKSKRIITSLIILPVLCLFLGFPPAVAAAKEKYEEKFEKTIPLAQDGKVMVKNVSGDIEVKSWNKSEVHIKALKVSKASSLDKAKENAEKVKINVNKHNNTLSIETEYPKTVFKSLNVSIYYYLMIPAQAEIKAQAVSGDVKLEGIGGMVKAKTVSGDITVMEAKKGVNCEAVSGDLTIQNIRGDVYLKTVSGDIKVEGIQGSIEAESVSGEIDLGKVSEAQVIKASTVSGEITYQGEIRTDGQYSLKSLSGDVRFQIPADSAFDFEAKSYSGEINTDFEITITGKVGKKEVRGTVNGGGAEVDLSTFSGDIHLEKR